MVRRTNLRPDTRAALAEITKRLSQSATNKNTTPTGVKDLGSRGDVVWTNSDGTVVESMRDLGAAMGEVATDLSYLNGTILPSIKDATYIDDDSITTRLLAADSVGANQIIANSITGDKIKANSIAADRILGGAFTGKTFTGGTYTGGVFKTSEVPNTAGGVQLDAEYGVRGWSPNSRWQDPTFQLSPSDGSVHISANLYAMDSGGNGLILEPKTALGSGGLFFTDDGRHTNKSAGVFRNAYSTVEAEDLLIRGANGGIVWAINGLGTDGPFSASGNVNSAKEVWAKENVSGNRLLMRDPITTSGESNVRWSSTNHSLYALTSSRRYKRNIADWNPDPQRVLALQPRQWQHNDPEHPEDIDERWHAGFVAEEVDDLGLTHLVQYGGDGAGGWRPEALNYSRVPAAQQIVLQDHEARIAALEAQITELENTNG